MEHSDLVAEISAVEKMSPVERLVHARKRRAHQLKQYRRYEKKIDKESTKKRKPNSYSSSKKLKSFKRDVDFADNIKLLEAAARNDTEEVHELLMKSVNPDLTNEDGLTALHQCCIDESKKLMQLLLDYGANINARDSELWTPMHAAATCGHIRLCEILINHNADLLAVNADGNMPYDICEDEETLDLIENEMAKRGITQEQIDETRDAKERQMYNDLVKYVKQGGNLQDIRDYNGVTPLHIAAANGYLEVAKYLLNHKVPVNPRDDESWEPIHAAACWQESLMLDLLVEYGADIDSRTKKNDTPFDICDDPDIKQKILDMKDYQENQKRKSSGSIRKTGRPNNRSASLRRSSMRGEKSALFMKEAKEEAAHFGVMDLNSSNHITEEDDDDDDEEDDDLAVTCLDDVELIMDDIKENNAPKLTPDMVSQKSYQNGDRTNERNRLKSSDSFHSKISEVVLMTQKPKSPTVIASPSNKKKPIATSPSNTRSATSLSKTSTANFPRQTPLTDSKESTNSSKNSLKDSRRPIPLETNLDRSIKRVGPTSSDVSALAKKFNLMSSNTNDTKPLETVLGRPVANSGQNSNRSSKTSVKENRNPSAEVSHTKNNNNYNTAVSQNTESSSNRNWTLQSNKSSNDSLKQQTNNKLVNGAELNEKSVSQSSKTAAPVKTPTTPLDISKNIKAPIPASHSVAPKSSGFSTPTLSNSRLKDDRHGNGVKGPTDSNKASNFIMTSSTSRPVDVRVPLRNADNTPSFPTDKDNANTQFEKDRGKESTRKETAPKSVHHEGRLPTNIPYEPDNSSRPIPTLDSEGTTAAVIGVPQLEQRYPTNRTTGCTLSDLKRQRQATYNRRGSTGSGASTERLALTGENTKTILSNFPSNSTSAHMHDSPILSSKFPSPASATVPTIGNYSTWTTSMSNGNDAISKYSAPSTVQVVGDEEKKCCCVIM